MRKLQIIMEVVLLCVYDIQTKNILSVLYLDNNLRIYEKKESSLL